MKIAKFVIVATPKLKSQWKHSVRVSAKCSYSIARLRIRYVKQKAAITAPNWHYTVKPASIKATVHTRRLDD